MEFKLILIIFSILFIQIYTLEEVNEQKPLTYEELVELVNSPEFQVYKEELQEEDLILESSGLNINECLIPKSDAVKLLSQDYGISNSNPDDNLRFILGKCYPVLMVPGIYATKLVVELQCKKIASEERTTTLKNLRLYCGHTLCPDESKTREEHPLFMAILDKAFSILGPENDKYSSCLAFIMNYFQNENECPNVNNKNICYYSKYITVGFYGGSTNTEKDGKCGVEGVQNIIQTGRPDLDKIINLGAAQSFGEIARRLIKRGYKEGFSLGGLPNDFRRYLTTNNFATQVFKDQIERLYSNTGKPVVVVAHSYGTLLTLTNLLKEKDNKTFLNKVKKFIAIAPPFAGATKLLDAFFHGLQNWNKEFEFFGSKIVITNYNTFGQLLMYKSLPTLTELRPLPIAANIFTDSKYSKLGDAIKSRLDVETKCKNKDCSINELKSKTSKFDEIFKGYFPSLTDDECAYESSFGDNNETLNRKCYTGIYNVGNCPTIIKKSVNPTQEGLDKDLYCNKYGSSYYYQGDCIEKKRNCLDEMYYSNKCPNVFKNKEAVNYLLNRFNGNYTNKFGSINKNYFDSYNSIQQGVKSSIEYQTQTSLIKDLPPPPVDTDIVYSSFAPTPAALVLDDEDFTKKGEILYKGGDQTVPTWSSLLTGLKWIYDKKENKLPQNIRLIEYCSRLSKSGKYKYDAKKNQKFAALGCGCINLKGYYIKSIGSCVHASMIGDDDLIDYIISVVDDPKETPTVTSQKKISAKNYKSNINYESVCNSKLKHILDHAK